MIVDWLGFGYALIVALGGAVGYIRKGSKISLIAGIIFGITAGYGAYCVTHNPRDIKISLFTAFLLTTVMGVRFKRSKKLMPAGIVAGLSLLMILRLVLMLV
ncbi:transmembrane protein 14A [Hemicordylus capensis]|uniref:transmembrane protein 14A n=1 Tax=Hemicordylus capensis TaxID=884348 RepID=UPI00230299F2|nr:transmembrane protein 14A [Hemicordylus capensis]XP_053142319.1 transmembrane protein 14A [Hemicordylus capensis]XP_053142320.1 transmembrane protein 14A [Hemicordylus capensis]XP_053142321.1 transmembrane protein 14A [Hemicordylus capensis]